MTFTAPLPADLEAVARGVAPPEMRETLFGPAHAQPEIMDAE
jgi:hypothetical protein